MFFMLEKNSITYGNHDINNLLHYKKNSDRKIKEYTEFNFMNRKTYASINLLKIMMLKYMDIAVVISQNVHTDTHVNKKSLW